ncbi:hypothetical protein FRZ44_33010 [Hypericibacter terrae]|uniref:Uncharacterized protein n=1 Tax=Hypericibacter terrae TaxID=2602015 RepID=A0A5J6MLG8_9PROT|nr:three component ABC system middle component [Hypericibacter terrae]QEX17997.1 hypothetical protein FRZ44_33010 [Hypericibacter terrae]
MKVAHDVFSETNPAYCTYALVAFTTAYLSVNEGGPEVPLIYLALPLALSGDLAIAFRGTNKSTGLLEWLERNPRVQVGLAARGNATMEIVTEAIRFACFTRVVEFGDGGRLRLGPRKFKKSARNALSEEPAQAIKHAERLGYWFAMTGSTRGVFDMMGLTV